MAAVKTVRISEETHRLIAEAARREMRAHSAVVALAVERYAARSIDVLACRHCGKPWSAGSHEECTNPPDGERRPWTCEHGHTREEGCDECGSVMVLV
jgi:hypothetical protein